MMGMPSLANVPPGQPDPMGDPMASGGALPRLVFEIEQSIKTLGRALPPGASEKLDPIVQQLREVVALALNGGPTEMGGSPEQAGGPF